MGEIVDFVHHGAAKITPKILQDTYRKLPMLRLEFAEIDDPGYPHLPEQLEFLAAVVEDFAEGVVTNIPYVTIASAVFALLYAHRQIDLIPDSIPGVGHADDSAVVRAVLIENEKVLAEFAEKQGLVWEEVSVNP
jgi:uncharacterized membrane protein YkvA (DUF1232 family)